MCQYNDTIRKGATGDLMGRRKGRSGVNSKEEGQRSRRGGDYMKGKERTSKGRSERQRGGVSVKREE